jgi:hypothetical protein
MNEFIKKIPKFFKDLDEEADIRCLEETEEKKCDDL